jgi:CubicO group peptidase (beta-lactamase class C family)
VHHRRQPVRAPRPWSVPIAAFVLVGALLALSACGTPTPPVPEPEPDLTYPPEVTERSLTNITGWWWLDDASADEVEERIAAGFRIIDLEIVDTDPWRYTVAMVADAGVHEKDWWWYSGDHVTADYVLDRVEEHGARILDVEAYDLGGAERFAVVLVPDEGDAKGHWWWYFHADVDFLVDRVAEHRARVVDLDRYTLGGTSYWSAVMLENSGDNELDWSWLFDVPHEEITATITTFGQRIVVLEPMGPDRYAAVLVDDGVDDWRWFLDVTAEEVTALTNLHGQRVIDLEPSASDGDPRFDVVTVVNERHCDVAEAGTVAPVSENPVIDQAVQREMCAQGLIGLAVGVVEDGQIVYLRGYGHEDGELRVPVEAKQTMFRWASVSKTVTGLAAAQVAVLGGVDLDANVAALVPEYVLPTQVTYDLNEGVDGADPDWQTDPMPRGAFISLRMLVSNTSGIKHYSNGFSSVGTPPASERNDPAVHTSVFFGGPYFWDDPDHLVAVPGTAYDYSSYGFNLAGMAIERGGTGNAPTTYWEKVRDRIAVPLGMTPATALAPDYPPTAWPSGTFFQPDYEWISIPRRAVGYALETTTVDDAVVETGHILDVGSSDVSWKVASGGFISTVEHMALYCLGLLTSTTTITDAMRDLMWAPTDLADGTTSDYGLGFNIGTRNGRDLMAHSGFQQKARTHLYVYPDDGTCFMVMSNSEWADSRKLVRVLEDAYRLAFP